jgi:hypothetical protein
MRHPRKLARSLGVTLLPLLTLVACRRQSYVVPEAPMPPNTVLLSQSLRELTALHPELPGKLIDKLDNGGKRGPALLTPKLLDELRKRVLGKDWQGLDRFPGWTMRAINPTVRVVGHIAGKDVTLETASAVHPGAPVKAPNSKQQDVVPQLSAEQQRAYLDLGPYALDQGGAVALDEPSPLPPFTTEGLVTPLGDGFVRGDGPNQFAPEHAASQRLADLLNRLAANKLDGAATVSAGMHPVRAGHRKPRSEVAFEEQRVDHTEATTPEGLMQILQETGHTVTVDDARYFANFAHLHYKGMDVMAPFWIDTRLTVPGSRGDNGKARPLQVPVSHAELEWHIRGPHVNADVSYYFGVDGKAEWRTMDTLDQAWVLRRAAHTYTGDQALEVSRLAGLMTVAYMHLHAAHPALPFGGYYALGVCQDGVSAIEKKMTGAVTLFPNTADIALFNDPRDAEINALFKAIPHDRDGDAPSRERIFGSLPVAPADDSRHAFDAITIPGLAADLNAVYSGAAPNPVDGPHSWRTYVFAGATLLILIVSITVFSVYRRDRIPT